LKTIIKYQLIAVVILALFGCAQSPLIPQLHDEVIDTKSLLQELSVQMYLQEEKLIALQMTNSELGEQLQYLRNEYRNLINLNQQKDELNPGYSALEQKTPTEETLDNPETVNSALLDKMIVGRVEWVWLEKLDASYKAQMDTGVKSAQINAKSMQMFERDGNTWVKFMLHSSGDHQDAMIEVPVERSLKSRSQNNEEKPSRPVIKLKLRLGSWVGNVKFTVYERKNSNYDFVLGRSFLQDIALVDVAQSYTKVKISGVTK